MGVGGGWRVWGSMPRGRWGSLVGVRDGGLEGSRVEVVVGQKVGARRQGE